MFGLGASEIVVILALALIVFGPQKLPELAKQLARLVGDLRRAADDVKQNFEEATRDPPKPPPPPPVAVQALLSASQQAQANKTAADKAHVVEGALPDHAPLVNKPAAPDYNHGPGGPGTPLVPTGSTPDYNHGPGGPGTPLVPTAATPVHTPPAIPTSAPVGTVSASDKHVSPDPAPSGTGPSPSPSPSPSTGVGHG